MNRDMSCTNVSFEFLRRSPDFLNCVLNNITSCVMLLDKEMYIKAYNDPLKSIFSSRANEDLLYIRCGEAIGCAYQVEEAKECGKTSKCCDCDLRISALHSYTTNEVVYKDRVTRPFFNIQGFKEDKHLQFSTRLFVFQKDKYIIMIVDDITRLVNLEKRVNGHGDN